jgi:PIN domain nuclease of toxin-antitoxin system
VAAVIYLDTHVVVWLAAGRTDLLTPVGVAAIEEHDLLISPMIELELQYLFETGRIRQNGRAVVNALSSEIGLGLCEHPFGEVVVEAVKLDWTRDPFDRLIVAQALLGKAQLLTKDSTIRAHYKHALWD